MTVPQATLVIGAGGLLGSALMRLARPPVRAATVRWGGENADADLEAAVRAHLDELPDVHEWRIIWCAGAGVTGTSEEDLAREVTTFRRCVETVVRHAGDRRGTLFLASSAGGVYAGSADPPFTEHHAPHPLAPYGHAKLAMEDAAREVLAGTPHRLAIGRIANIYGPGQNLGKMQGLVSHLCKALVTGQPVGVYVPVDTIRDYLYVDDCARMVLALCEAVVRQDRSDTTKILCSGRGVTIGELIGVTRRVSKRRPHIIFAASRLASLQSLDLRLRSVVLPEIDSCVSTTLPTGISATARAVGDVFRSGQLAPL